MGIWQQFKETFNRSSRELAEKRTQRHRERLGQSLADKEQALKDLEARLQQREINVSNLEKGIKKYYLIPHLYIQVPVDAALCIGATFAFMELAPPTPTKNTGTPIGTPSGSGSASKNNPMTKRETEIYAIYHQIDPKRRNFDVGNYCLEREKRGVVTFDECLAIAASKLATTQ